MQRDKLGAHEREMGSMREEGGREEKEKRLGAKYVVSIRFSFFLTLRIGCDLLFLSVSVAKTRHGLIYLAGLFYFILFLRGGRTRQRTGKRGSGIRIDKKEKRDRGPE